MLRVLTLAELNHAVETLASVRELRGDRLAVISNGGGIGVLATDALVEAGGRHSGAWRHDRHGLGILLS